MNFAAHDVIDVLSLQPFHIFVNNFFAKAMHLPKHEVVAYATEPSKSDITASSIPLFHSPIRTLNHVDRRRLSNVHLATCKATKLLPITDAKQKKETTSDNQHTLVAADRYKLTIERVSQIWDHTYIQSNATEQLTKDRKDEFALSAE